MSETLQANIFFLIASIAVIVFTIMVCVVVYYIIKIARAASHIMDRMDETSTMLAQDITNIRTHIAEGRFIKAFASALAQTIRRKKQKTRRTRTKKEQSDEE